MPLVNLRQVHQAEAGSTHVIITEVTRMGDGMVCVAGMDLHTSRMVRPLQPGGYNWEEGKWVSNDPGFFRVGNLVKLEAAVQKHRDLPHGHEDHLVKTVTLLQSCTADELFEACTETSDNDLPNYFNGHIIDCKYVVEKANCPSLGCTIVAKDDIRLSDKYNAIQISIHRFEGWYNLKLTDLIAKSKPDSTAGMNHIKKIVNNSNSEVALRIGLARPWRGRNGEYDPRRCFLQVNGVIPRP